MRLRKCDFGRVKCKGVKVFCPETGKVYDSLDAAARDLGMKTAIEAGCENPQAWQIFYETCKAGIQTVAEESTPTFRGYHFFYTK